MRVALVIVSAFCIIFGVRSYAQGGPCPAHLSNANPSEKLLTPTEVAHQIVVNSTPEEMRQLYWGDVEFVLRCGSEQDAAELFAAIRGQTVRMNGAAVFESGRDFISVSWDDGFNLGGFRFSFDTLLRVLPIPGQRVLISGTYSSYSREPFQINFANSSFIPMLAKPELIKPRSRFPSGMTNQLGQTTVYPSASLGMTKYQAESPGYFGWSRVRCRIVD